MSLYFECLCKKQPTPGDAPEGFQRDQYYFYETATQNGRRVYRIFPDGCHPLDAERFFHVVSEGYFNEHFEAE
jgi:hypothetical protein